MWTVVYCWPSNIVKMNSSSTLLDELHDFFCELHPSRLPLLRRTNALFLWSVMIQSLAKFILVQDHFQLAWFVSNLDLAYEWLNLISIWVGSSLLIAIWACIELFQFHSNSELNFYSYILNVQICYDNSCIFFAYMYVYMLVSACIDR